MKPADSLATQPRYRALAETLREEIVAGVHAPGTQLPTEAELASRFGMSRGTVVKAIDTLVAEGVVTKRQGAGSFVSQPSLHRRSSRLMSFTETLDAQGRTAGQKVLSYAVADPEEARGLGVHDPAMLLARLRFVDGLPMTIHRSFIPEWVMARLSVESLGQLLKGEGSLYAAFESAGVTIDRGSEHVSARLARKDEAATLKLATPAVLMVVIRQSYDGEGQLIEAAEAIYNAEHYTYDLDLVRGQGHSAPHRLQIAQDASQDNLRAFPKPPNQQEN